MCGIFQEILFVQVNCFVTMCFWLFTWKPFVESVLYLKNHDIMPDTVLYICYHTVFICWVFFFLPYADTICRGECCEWRMIGYERGWDERDEMKKCVWNQSNHGAQSELCTEGAQAHQCNSRLLDIPERLAAWKSLTEDGLEFGVEVPLDVWAQQAELSGRWCPFWLPEEEEWELS